MTRLMRLLGLSFAACTLPTAALAHSVTLEPGFYASTHMVKLGGQELQTETVQYCVRDGENSRSLYELVETLSNGGQCKLSNVTMTETTWNAEIACSDTGLGLDIRGTVDANFGPDFYNVDAVTALGPLALSLTVKVRRTGVCPADWKNPDEDMPHE